MNTSNRWAWLTGSAGAIVLVVLVVSAIAALMWFGGPRPETEAQTATAWTCSMHPDVRMDRPGMCPKCNMPLIPVSQLGSEYEKLEQGAGLEVKPVSYRELFKEIRATGKLDYNERRVAYITARIKGRVDRVYADVTGIQVKANDHLVDIYSPELYVAQEELLQALAEFESKPNERFAQTVLDAARTKLRLLGILPEQIDQIEKSRKQTTHLTIYAPIGGVVVEKNIREQQYVDEGDMLYRIADLDPIWLYLDIYERDLAWVRYGQAAEVTVEAYPGQTFEGRIVFIDPFLNDETRTVRVRVNLANPDGKLKPAMYASARVRVQLQPDGLPQRTGLEGKYICPMHPEIVSDGPGQCSICQMPLEQVQDLFPPQPAVRGETVAAAEHEIGKALAIPKSAVLDTGRRQVTYRKNRQGAYELVELKLGPLAEAQDESGKISNYYPVLAGLSAGDQVVVQGGFLLDSQRQIEGMPSLLYSEGQSGQSLHAGHGAPPTDAPPAQRAEHKH
jgi:Cu(I)/Ag(I) efflux system membrane fusion protein